MFEGFTRRQIDIQGTTINLVRGGRRLPRPRGRLRVESDAAARPPRRVARHAGAARRQLGMCYQRYGRRLPL